MKKAKQWIWRSRRRKIGAGVTLLCLLFASAALAYYLIYTGATGSGTINNIGTSGGNQQTATAVTLTANQSTTYAPISGSSPACTALAPGCQEEVDLTAANNNPNQAEKLVTTPTVTISVDAAHASAGCQASWFSWTNGTDGSVDSTTTIPIGSNNTSEGYGYVNFNDSGTNQNACQGATLTLALTDTTNP